ncbi:uncharacterized protein PV06_02629 [Exophiala oligosperma]|uniref:CBF1-interacting co-repressor CIR N-terminal domain-containing protein n=1 Tax=Exophiala oligosperma TaxID=215243 RepID=A0A0D2DWN9_9EURO|nr:uncharacterized protein PV06_02629 [Exophiala oligosperma]KIW47015.1 hypothetical protein PV06_02629 [Exophiala oligosperma]
MPLHLLGKKSWNVYNPANIERVRRDEAEAKRHEEEQEARQRDDESDNRLRLLRGEASLLQDPGSRIDLHSSSSPSYKRKRKLPGEDDTDRDIRLAKQPDVRRIDKLVDAKGNFSLIPVPESSNKKARVDEDPFTVYLSHAAGKGKNSGDKPWYSSTPGAEAGPPTRDSWGNDSPRRQEREAARVAANDPLAAMKKGVKQLREAERHRKEWMDQRERDLREVEDLARQRRRGRRKRDDLQKDDDLDSLDDFDLDQGYPKDSGRDDNDDHGPRQSREHKHHHHHRHRRHHRSRLEVEDDYDARERPKRERARIDHDRRRS